MIGALTASTWAYPALEVLHLFGIALLLGNLVLLEMRVFGWGVGLPVRPLAKLSLGLAVIGFSLAALSGTLMFATRALELLANKSFTLKMGLLMLAGCNAAWFHTRESLDKLDGVARVQMVISTALWLAIMVCGRWIAYQ